MDSNSSDEAFSTIIASLSRKDTDSVPILCNLLQQPYEDETTVMLVTYCLIRIADQVCLSPAGVAELGQSGFIPSTFRVLVSSALPHQMSKELLHVYVLISRGSFEASKALFELDVARVAKDNIAPSSGLCRGALELIDALLPNASNQHDRIQLRKVKFLRTRTELVEKLGKDVVPLLVDSGGADSYISYGGLSIIKKLIGLCSTEFLADLLKSVNISSFLAVAFTRHDPHVTLLALQTSELILNLSSEFQQSFLQEGVFFSIALLCYSFDQGDSMPSSHDSSGKLEKDSVHNLAKYITSRYFPSKSSNSDETLSVLSTQLSDMTNDDALRERHDDIFSSLLDHIFGKLSGSEPISTLELVEGGIVKLLVECFSDTKRIRVFMRHFVSSSEAMATLVQKLQTGLSLLEAFPQKHFSSDILQLLSYLANINSCIFDMIYEDRIEDFTRGKLEDLDSLKISIQSVPQIELLNTKLTERLQQEMRDSIPTWCKGLMVPYPFLFGFDARRKFFQLDAFGVLEQPFPSRGFLVSRDRILESASQMMELFSGYDRVVSVKYKGEPGSGPGPTREFYTLLSHELQDAGTGMWREDSSGLFPHPLKDGKFVSQVSDKFVLLGRTVARALREGRVLDLRFSKAFYKLILGKELGVYDVLLFDQALGRTLIEFMALVRRKEYLESAELECETLFRGTRIEDLCLDFTLPGYPDFVLGSGLEEEETVTMQNLKDYISLVLDATIGSGISNQVEPFKYGFNQLFPMKKLEVFTEEELERLLCGESECWSVDELVDHVKFGDGYTATSPPMVNLLEIIAEFDEREQRGFLQFVTGAPRLPLGGFASLNPNLTIVGKASIEGLPSVMTCVNYLKMPPYSSKQVMRQKLLYAITEGQGSFQFS